MLFPNSKHRVLKLRAAAAAALLIGYGTLWSGNVTIAPILLVLAYLVLIPAVILA